jgi:hypothetical protein
MMRGLCRKDFCFMLMRTVIFASIAAALATQVPSFFTGPENQPAADAVSANYVSPSNETAMPAPVPGSGSMRLQAEHIAANEMFGNADSTSTLFVTSPTSSGARTTFTSIR